MEKKQISIWVVSIIFTLIGCSQAGEFPEFDWDKWKADYNGCNGTRLELLDAFKQIKPQLKGQSSQSIILHLGNPDDREIHKRNQQYFRYFLTHESCNSEDVNKDNTFIQLRLNATGFVDEIIFVE